MHSQIDHPSLIWNEDLSTAQPVTDGLDLVLASHDDVEEHTVGIASVTSTQSSFPLPPWAMALLLAASIAVSLALILTVMYCLKCNVKQRDSIKSGKPSNGSACRQSIEFVLPQIPMLYPSEPQTELHTPGVFDDVDELYSILNELPPAPLPSSRERHSTTSASSVSNSSVCSSPTRRKSISARGRSGSVLLEELDLSMYGDARDDELRGVTTIHSRGRICFSAVHDNDNECVVINVLRAYGLTSAINPYSSGRTLMSKQRRMGRMDTSVKVHLIGNKTQGHVTKVVRDNCDPVYDESFCFHLSRSDAQLDATIRIWIQEHDRFSRRTDIGAMTFCLSELDEHTSPGDVMEVWRDLVTERQAVNIQGRLLVSMQYDYRERFLRIGVLSANNLRLPHYAEPIAEQGVIYVKLTLITNDKVLSRRKSLSRRITDCPVFNDGFSFAVNFHMLENVTLVFTVYAKDLTGKSTMIGRANVGSLAYAFGSGLKHWNEMLAAPSAVTEIWHDLL